MARFDAIIAGGGHNGLVAAGYLAKAGLRVAVVERRSQLGGPAATKEFSRGFFSTITNSPGSLEPKIIRDMDLERLGLRFVKPDPTLVHPLADGRLFVGWRDRARTAALLESYRRGESERYNRLFEHLQWFADRLGISVFRAPPTLKELVRNLDTIEEQEAFSRIFFGSVRDLFAEFELAPETQAVLGPISTVSGIVGPSTPGTPFTMMLRPLSLASLPDTDDEYDPRRMPLRGSTGLPVGGMGAIIDAMERCLRARGVTIFKDCPVAAILADGRGISGLALEDGRELSAPIVVSAMNPYLTIEKLRADEPEWVDLRAKMRRRPLRGKAFKVVLALDDFPHYAAAGSEGEARALAAAQFRIAPTLDYLDDSYSDMLRGRVPERPIIWGLCHSLTSPSLAPEGKHVLSLNIGNAPYHLREGEWAAEREPLVSRVLDVLEQWMPRLRDTIIDYRCIDPTEFEEEYGLVEANITHGDVLPSNQFWMRPLPGLHAYRTPTQGLYLCGNGTWPGTFVSGVPGHNAAHVVLEDLATGPRRQPARVVS